MYALANTSKVPLLIMCCRPACVPLSACRHCRASSEMEHPPSCKRLGQTHPQPYYTNVVNVVAVNMQAVDANKISNINTFVAQTH